ncbi:glycoside hydrolase family 78 protein [uncultured Amnibacterium sp.]|uniref:glycoside hydrolase family 78 protein n=1 Tax=uncultured Amnibacterium sp. TaxID=1631851 RepID=UPI0035CC16DD
MSEVTMTAVTVEHHREPFGIGEARPRLSWTTATEAPDWRQAAYELEITPDGGEPWSSGRVDSDESVLVAWVAPPLASRERRSIRVRVWGDGGASGWSDPTVVEAGLLEPADWTAQLIQPVLPEGVDEPVVQLRREFELGGEVVRARLHVTAHGVVEVALNGTVVGDEVLAPGWTSYRHRLRYRTHDVTALLVDGPNAIGAELADGWFRGYVGFTGTRAHYGDRTGLLLQLEIDHADGTRTTVGSDGSWRSATGATVSAGLYSGETFDARLEAPGWARAGFDAAAWAPVEVAPFDPTVLVAPTGPPVRRTQLVLAQRVLASPSGATLVDFGQNLVGRIRFALPDGPAGTRITIRHAEVLEHGELGTRPLRAARATDTVILDGRGPRVWEPRFTFHGFRYAEVTGWPGGPAPADLTAVVIHTDLERTGTFACSDPEVERLHENVVWGMRGNFLDVPTDCPQRDERLGWTGDLQVFAPTASFLYATAGMLRSWLADLAVEQADAGGNVPIYVPFLPLLPFEPGAEVGWGDAAVVVPWVLFQRFGDVAVLEAQWRSMTDWIDVFAARAGADLDFPGGGFSFGDWLDPIAPPENPGAARVPWQAVATAYLSRSARIVADAAAVLGRDGARFAHLADRAAERFRREYVTPNGRVAYPSQTAYALALEFGLVDEAQRAETGRLLAEQVAADGFRIGTGFLGTPVVADALTGTGSVAAAYALLLQREQPSWLYPVTMGATTVWERWDSMLPDGTINPGDMTSFNHYAYGAVADWLHRVVAGLAPAEPGYRRIRIAPRPGPGITAASAAHQTPYGRAAVSWTVEADAFALDVVVPPNASAEVLLPTGEAPILVGSGRHRYERTIAVPAAVQAPALHWSPDA